MSGVTPRIERPPSRVVIVGGGPGGYEAALVARRGGADVVVVERKGLGGNAVLTDVVPSKTLIATAEWMRQADSGPELGIRHIGEGGPEPVRTGLSVDLGAVNARVLTLAAAQSADIRSRLEREGVRIIEGTARLDGPLRVVVSPAQPADDGPSVADAVAPPSQESVADAVAPPSQEPAADVVLEADVVLLSVGSRPRELDSAKPDGERILRWDQLYALDELPSRLIVVGSGVTGAEFAGAYHALGCDVVLVSSRDQVLPGEDPDAAAVIQEVFMTQGMTVLSRSRASAARRTADGVVVELADGRSIEGSLVLMAVGSVPATQGLGLEEAGVILSPSGHIEVDRVSRTSARGVYAAGDCTGVFPLASVAATQGRIAMAHALGDAVAPLKLETIASTVFTQPEIATVGRSQSWLDERGIRYVSTTLELARNPRAKMHGIRDGFVKLFAHATSGEVLGGVVVAPRASELILPVALAVAQRLTVDEVADTATIYPSLTGSIAETARMLHDAGSH